MLERYGIGRDDYRNLLVVVGIVALVTVLLSEEPLVVRLIVGLVTGTISAVAFLVVTALINTFGPDHW